ncbi:MAG: AAA family ATPase [Anaerolineae bacterium]
MLDLPLSVEFRSEVIKPVLTALTSGESCSLVGVGSSGKSNVARHLERYDVRAHHLGDRAQDTLSILVPCTKLSKYSALAMHSLILQALPQATQQAGPKTMALRPKIEEMWRQAAESTSSEMMGQALEDVITTILKADVSQIFVIFDDFDHVVQNLPAQVLNGLRVLRDNHKFHLMYVTVTRHELAFLGDEDERKDFYEIVTPTTIAIGPYREVDANFMIDRLVARWNFSLSEVERQRLLKISGRHAGLIKAILQVTGRKETTDLLSSEILEKLREHPRIQSECDEIWKSLEEEEIACLQILADQGRLQGVATRRLERKGLIRPRSKEGYEIFSPVFARYILDRSQDNQPAIELIPSRQGVRLADQTVKSLDAVEYRLLAYLYKRCGQSITRQELIGEMLAGEVKQRRFPGPPDHRLDSYMMEIKRKIDSPQQQYIIFEPNGAYRIICLQKE